MEPLRIFIGYDRKEAVAYHVLCQSIIDMSSVPVSITPIKRTMLPIHNRDIDKTQSNEFSFTRFLIPHLCRYRGVALFMDCDMMFRADPKELFAKMDMAKSVMVVKHDYKPRDETKYLGAVQYAYPKKNWSSVMLFNCEHDHCHRLTMDYVNTATGMQLHQFIWTHEAYVGELPKEYNHLVGEYEENPNARIVHWTIGGPWFNEYHDVEFSGEWRSVLDDVNYSAQKT